MERSSSTSCQHRSHDMVRTSTAHASGPGFHARRHRGPGRSLAERAHGARSQRADLRDAQGLGREWCHQQPSPVCATSKACVTGKTGRATQPHREGPGTTAPASQKQKTTANTRHHLPVLLPEEYLHQPTSFHLTDHDIPGPGGRSPFRVWGQNRTAKEAWASPENAF